MSRLFNAPLPVCIPGDVPRFPAAWCMNDGHDHDDAHPPTRTDIIKLEARLMAFAPPAQATLLFMLDRLCTPGTLLIPFDGKTIRLHRFLCTIKYGDDMEVQTRFLEILGCQAKKYGFEVGEIKALMYIASRKFWIWMGVCEPELENPRIAYWKESLGFEESMDDDSDKEWGGVKQFLPLVRKTIEFYEKTVVPEGTFDDSDEDLDED